MLRVMWFVPPLLQSVAKARGIAGSAGIEGTLTASSDQQYAALLAGSQDAVITSMDNVLLWNRRGDAEDFRIVAQVERTTSISLIARPQFQSIKDLNGRRLLVDSAENGFVIALRIMLHNAGVDFASCTILAAGGVKERYAALTSDDGDATLLGPPFVAMAEADGMKRLADADAMFEGFPGQGVVVRAGTIKQKREELERWLLSLDAARGDIAERPQKAIDDLVGANTPMPLAKGLVSGVGATLVPDREGVELLLEQRRTLGLPGANATYEMIVDATLLSAVSDVSV